MMLDDACPCYLQQTTVASTAAAFEDNGSVVLMLQLQAESFKEDYENERQDHQRTKAQVQSLMMQWNSLRDQLHQCRSKVRCGVLIRSRILRTLNPS